MQKIEVSAPARIDLSGGATDWCGMHTLALAINLRAYAKLEKLNDPNIIQIKIGDLFEEYEIPTYGTDLDLFKAVIELSRMRGFRVEYRTDIPKGSGLGGSAPLTVSTVFALSKLFDLGWNKYYIAELAQRAETLKMKTVNGYQDQYMAAFGGLIFMDFEGKACQKDQYSKPIEKEPYAVIENLSRHMPKFNIVVAIPEITRKGSDETNRSLSSRYLDGEEEIVEKMKHKAELTQWAKKAIVDEDLAKLYGIINANNDIMRDFGFVSEDNERIIKIAKEHGALATKTCGAGRGAVAIFMKDALEQKSLYKILEPVVEHVYMVEPDVGVRIEGYR